MNNVEILKNALHNSSLSEAVAVYDLIINGSDVIFDESVIDVTESGILVTYKIKAEHIFERAGEHAKRLAESTKEFVNAIETHNPQKLKTARVKSEGVGYFLIWYDPAVNNLIGCSFLIGNSEVSKAMWNHMWDNT